MSNFNNRATYQAPYWPPMPVQNFPQLPAAPPAFNICQYWSPSIPVPSVSQLPPGAAFGGPYLPPPPPPPTWNIPQPPPVRIRQRIAPIYSEKPLHIERQMIQKMHAGDYVASELSEKLNDFLIRRGKITRSYSYDFQKNLYTLIAEVNKNPYFLPKPIPIYDIMRVKDFRNELEHNNWDLVNTHMDDRMDSMIQLSEAIREREFANDIHEISNAIKAGDCSGGVAFKPFKFRASGAYSPQAGIGLKLISKCVLETYFVKNVWRQRQDRFGAPCSSLDVYENNLDMIDDLKINPNYLLPGSQRTLDLFQETRLDLSHGRHKKFFLVFELRYDNMVDYLWMLGEADAAIEVALIRDLLIELKRTGRQISTSYFPTLFPQ
jgi:hypothetical protein